jgi:hypothetical protein
VVLRGTEISYFEPGLDPFTLNGDYIVDSLPSLVYTDLNVWLPIRLYLRGRTRIADRLCDVMRVVARDGTRYSYIAWLDAETKLPCASICLTATVKRWSSSGSSPSTLAITSAPAWKPGESQPAAAAVGAGRGR